MTRQSPVQDSQQLPDHQSPPDPSNGLLDRPQTNDNGHRDLQSAASFTTNSGPRDDDDDDDDPDDSASPPTPPPKPSANSPSLHVQPPPHPPLRSQSTSQLLPTSHLLHDRSALPDLARQGSKGSLRARSSLSLRKPDPSIEKGKNRVLLSTTTSASASTSDGAAAEEDAKDAAQGAHQGSTRDRGRAIARLILPALHHTFSTKSPSSRSTPASGASSIPQSQPQSQPQTQPQSPQNPSAAGGFAPPPASLPVTLTPGSAPPAFSKPDTTKVPDMFSTNLVSSSTVEYITESHPPGGGTAPSNYAQTPASIQNQIHTTAYKRITTLSYLQDAYESKVHWYNTIFMSKTDISRMSYFEQSKLTRRANHFLVLGLSLPSILDLNNSCILDYLRALNALLLEFEAFQHARPPPNSNNGNSSTSSLVAARMKIPNMFKRTGHASHSANPAGSSNGGKRRTSSAAAEVGPPSLTSSPSWSIQNEQSHGGGDYLSSMASGRGSSTTTLAPSMSNVNSPGGEAATVSYNGVNTAANSPLKSSSSYLGSGNASGAADQWNYLLTPGVPFETDFFQTFATLCDVLIASYNQLAMLTASPSSCTPMVGDLFAKADAKLKRIIVGGVVKEFEDVSRRQVKSELLGVSRIILAGS
ncbi:hypothetical protein KEM56_000599 [Ascosphaera pollenicola]|nr:hypothetical protein KEM56_000599 [Ascosphaera pollenicola]